MFCNHNVSRDGSSLVIRWIEAGSIDRTQQTRFHVMTREEPSLETLWLQDVRTMDKVQIMDRSNWKYSSGPSPLALEGMRKLWCRWWQREGNVSAIQNESIYQVHLCSACEVYMLISFSIYQVLPNRNIIHKEQILSTSQSTGCQSPDSHRRGG
jgi:hypothetical protein